MEGVEGPPGRKHTRQPSASQEQESTGRPPAEPSSSSSSEHGSQAPQSGTDYELSRMQLLLMHEVWQATSCTALSSGPAMACYTFSAAESSVHMALLQVPHTHLRMQPWEMLMGLPHASASVQRLPASRAETGARLPSQPRAGQLRGLHLRTNAGRPNGVRAALDHDQRYSIHMCSALPCFGLAMLLGRPSWGQAAVNLLCFLKSTLRLVCHAVKLCSTCQRPAASDQKCGHNCKGSSCNGSITLSALPQEDWRESVPLRELDRKFGNVLDLVRPV